MVSLGLACSDSLEHFLCYATDTFGQYVHQNRVSPAKQVGLFLEEKFAGALPKLERELAQSMQA